MYIIDLGRLDLIIKKSCPFNCINSLIWINQTNYQQSNFSIVFLSFNGLTWTIAGFSVALIIHLLGFVAVFTRHSVPGIYLSCVRVMEGPGKWQIVRLRMTHWEKILSLSSFYDLFQSPWSSGFRPYRSSVRKASLRNLF